MGFQETVAVNQGFGVVGELFLDGPLSAQPGIIDSVGTTPAFNRVGRAFTQVADADGHCTIGGTGAFYGILANPKSYVNFGVPGNALAPSLDLAQYAEGEFVQQTAGIIVDFGGVDAAINDLVDFVQATGVLVPRTSGVITAGNSNIPGARVVRYNTDTGLSVIAIGTVNIGAPIVA